MAGLTLVYQDDAVRIYWHEEHAYYMSDWQPVFRKGADLRRAYQACVDAAKTRRGAFWLIDSSKFTVVDQADVKWIEETFWPEFVRAGATYAAVIPPQKEVSKMSASRSAKKAIQKGGFEVTVHASRAEAEAALLERRGKHGGD
ncbi:MAG TPA: hypothetical protein VMR86_16905 [Myxococcota bacterium]|nr:hypothetical protein [Myxococcota bacterium]